MPNRSESAAPATTPPGYLLIEDAIRCIVERLHGPEWTVSTWVTKDEKGEWVTFGGPPNQDLAKKYFTKAQEELATAISRSQFTLYEEGAGSIRAVSRSIIGEPSQALRLLRGLYIIDNWRPGTFLLAEKSFAEWLAKIAPAAEPKQTINEPATARETTEQTAQPGITSVAAPTPSAGRSDVPCSEEELKKQTKAYIDSCTPGRPTQTGLSKWLVASNTRATRARQHVALKAAGIEPKQGPKGPRKINSPEKIAGK